MRITILLFVLACCSVVAVAEDGAKYLVIARDEYVASVEPLVEWKRLSGISCKLVSTSEVGSDTHSVHTYIRDAWTNWPVKPEFVLLVGHQSYLPSFRYGNRWPYYSDNSYGDVSGDYRAELMVGRLPARSTAQCDEMVEKTLAYERTPDLADSLWMRRLTTLVRQDYDPDDTIYWNNARYLASRAGAAGFVSCDSLSNARGHTLGDLVNSVNTGTGMVMYRGTAGGNWREPFDVNPATLGNGKMLPLILSITCETMSLNPYDSMVGSAWVKAGWNTTMRGAVAFLGNTHSASNVARQRGAMARGFATGLFDENRYVLGDAFLRAKEQMVTEFPSDDEDYRGFNLFGDPSLRLWTGTPRRLDVSHPLEILRGPQQLEVTVTSGGVPVPDARVCAAMDSSVYAVDSTDAAGAVSLYVSPADTGRMSLVVVGQNLLPYEGDIRVVFQTGLAAERPAPVERSLDVRPSAFRASALVSFGAVAPRGARLRVTDVTGRTAAVLDCAGRESVRLDGSGLGVGVWFCELVDAAGRGLGRARAARLD